MGPVTPLLAVWEAWKKVDPDVEALWVGTRHGPERSAIESHEIPFLELLVARFPRHMTLEWLTVPFRFLFAFYQAVRIVYFQKPNLVASAGGYSAVPIIFAAKLLGARIWVHQQDVNVTLTNRITVPFADWVTLAWEQSRRSIDHRARVVGNPVRASLVNGSRERAHVRFGTSKDKPTILVFGGGSGATWINQAIDAVALRLVEHANVIHVTGKGKSFHESHHPDYHVREFLDEEMADALALADLVVCRAGMGSITELAALAKPAILIPLPHSPQETNARAVEDACLVLDQRQITPDILLRSIFELLDNEARRKELGMKMRAKLRTHVADDLIERFRAHFRSSDK